MSELRERLRAEIEQHGTMWGVAREWGINPGTLWRIQKGGDSPQVRRKWGINKCDRTRLTIEATLEMIEQFDALCQARGMTRQQLLVSLLENLDDEL